jgi:hypothetical protein
MSLLSFSTIYGFDGVAEVRFRSLIRQKCCGRIRPVSARIRRFESARKKAFTLFGTYGLLGHHREDRQALHRRILQMDLHKRVVGQLPEEARWRRG